jgi:hypothetical protein
MRLLSLLSFLCLLASVSTGALTRNMESTATVRSTAVSGNVQIPTSVFYPVGATAGDGVDDRAAIQGALDAAEAGGGGIVQLGAGEYKVVLLYDATVTFDSGKTKLTGYYGLEIPANVTVRGAGMGVTRIKGYLASSTVDVGCVVSPKGMRSTAVAYACGPFTLANLSLDMDEGFVSVTGSAASGKITATAHGWADTTEIRFGGTPPSPLAVGTTYFVRDSATNDFKVAATSGGAAIVLTTNGTSVTVRPLDNRRAILLSAVHSTGIYCERVRFEDAVHHGIDCDYNKRLVCYLCEWTGEYPGSGGGTSSSWIQFDAGLCGPASTHLSASAAPIVDTVFDSCLFSQRAATDTSSTRDIDIGHGACNINGLKFINCDFYGRSNATSTAIALVETSSTASAYDNIAFDGCRFTTYASAVDLTNDFAIKAAVGTTTGTLKGWVVNNCTFNGQANGMLYCGNGSGSTVTAAVWQGFKGWKITNNTFNYSQTLLTNVGGAKSVLLAYGLNEAVISGNSVFLTGAETSATNLYPFYLNDTSGVICNNSVDQAGTCTGITSFIYQTAGAETACQATTIPFWRAAFYGNSSRCATSGGHFYLVGANGIDGGSTYNFQFWGNTFNGSGSYNVAYQYFASSANNTYCGGQLLTGYVDWDPGLMATGTELTQTVTVTGARTTLGASDVRVNPSASLPTGVVVKQARVTSADTVTITLLNTNSGGQDPTNIRYMVAVTQF